MPEWQIILICISCLQRRLKTHHLMSGSEREEDMINMTASASRLALVILFCFQGSQWTYSEAEQFMQNIDIMNSNLLKPFE